MKPDSIDQAQHHEIRYPAQDGPADVEKPVAEDGEGEGQRQQRQGRIVDPAAPGEQQAAPGPLQEEEPVGQQFGGDQGGEQERRSQGPALAAPLLAGAGPEQGQPGQHRRRDEGGEQGRDRGPVQEPEQGPEGAGPVPGAQQQVRNHQEGAGQGADVQGPDEPAVGAQGEGMREAQEEVHPQRRCQPHAQPGEGGEGRQQVGRQGADPQREPEAHQQAHQAHVVEVPGALAGGGGDHHQQPGGPGHQAGEQDDDGGDVEGLDQLHRQAQDAPVPPDRVDQDAALGLAVEEAQGLVQILVGHLAPVDQQQFVPLQEPGALGRAVREHLLDDHPVVLHLPDALVVRG